MLEEKILSDYKEALKSRDSLRSAVINFLRAELISAAIAKKKDKLDDAEVVSVIRKQIKQREDSIEQFTKGNRLDLAEKETKEMQLLKAYLPKELPLEEIKKIIEKVVSSSQAVSMKDMGRVMKEVTAKISGQADPKLVSELVKEKLSKPSLPT